MFSALLLPSAFVLGGLDWLTGYELSFFAFYFLPITAAAFLTVGLAFSKIQLLLKRERETHATLRRVTSEVKLLEGLLPICSVCKSIRDKDGNWATMEAYITERSNAQFSHSYCPDCLKREMHTADFMDGGTQGN
ncbi:MAG: hypothetical protein O3C57_08305 [Verrucomicrobia bacterium]|nr:hypothetical protein [Verrucomicrobiota bacterium]